MKKIISKQFLNINPLTSILIIVFLLSSILAFNFSELHDYRLYIIQWKTLLSGRTLPNYDNAYGIIHYLFTPFFWLSSQLPKFIYIFFYLLAIKILYDESLTIISYKVLCLSLTLLLINPLFWCFGVFYGSNDLFVSSVTLISIILYKNKKYYKSSFLIFLGITYKFFPILILPFLAIEPKKINYKYFFLVAFNIILIYLLGYLKWGESIFNPFIFGGERGAKMLSIFAFISSSYSPLSFLNIYHLDFLSVYFVIIIWVVTFIIYYLYNLDKIIMLLLAFSNVLLFYKVGHHQFYFTLLLITIYTIFLNYEKIKSSKILILSLILFWSFLFLVTLIYFFTNGYDGKFYFIRETVGLPFFILHILMNFSWFKLAFKTRKH